jgi:hypothetical protein
MKATVKRKGGQSSRVKSLKENRRDVTKAAKATVAAKPKSAKSKVVKVAKDVAADAAMAAAVAAGKSLIEAAASALKPLSDSQQKKSNRAESKLK